MNRSDCFEHAWTEYGFKRGVLVKNEQFQEHVVVPDWDRMTSRRARLIEATYKALPFEEDFVKWQLHHVRDLDVRKRTETNYNVNDIIETYVGQRTPIVDAVISIKNHMGRAWRRYDNPEAKKWLNAHILGYVFPENRKYLPLWERIKIRFGGSVKRD